jgi:YesN/AraC family two-component response regulator
VAYHELFVRLFIVPETTQNIRTRINSELKKQPILNADNEQNAEFVNRKQECDKQFERLEKHMTDSETWRNPNLTLPLLAYEVESNRTTLSRCISNAGYETFYDYLAHYRIKCFCELALAGKINNINDTFFEVGFRNRSTAYNQFRKIIGVTPSDYIKKVTRDKKENE